MTLEQELKDLSKTFREKLAHERYVLEKRLTDELAKDMQVILDKHDAQYKSWYGGVRETAQMFVNNHLTMYSIWADPSGDWDDRPRVQDLSEQSDEESE